MTLHTFSVSCREARDVLVHAFRVIVSTPSKPVRCAWCEREFSDGFGITRGLARNMAVDSLIYCNLCFQPYLKYAVVLEKSDKTKELLHIEKFLEERYRADPERTEEEKAEARNHPGPAGPLTIVSRALRDCKHVSEKLEPTSKPLDTRTSMNEKGNRHFGRSLNRFSGSTSQNKPDARESGRPLSRSRLVTDFKLANLSTTQSANSRQDSQLPPPCQDTYHSIPPSATCVSTRAPLPKMDAENIREMGSRTTSCHRSLAPSTSEPEDLSHYRHSIAIVPRQNSDTLCDGSDSILSGSTLIEEP